MREGNGASASLRPRLPIDELLPEIAQSLQRVPSLVIEAAPGAGKTTRVPPLLLESVEGEVLVLEPRRIAARLAAMRAASEMGESIGETVGFQVRFEAAGGKKTRLRFLTEGVLTRRLISDPELSGVDAVILDEFHERHLDTDLALTLLKRLQERRPELKLIVMSATLDTAPIAAYLKCPVLRSSGREYSLEIRHQVYSALPLEQQVQSAVEGLLREQQEGHILVFLPGAAEIHRCMRACEPLARMTGAVLLPLFGDLAPEQQDRALAPTRERKVIFATNLAESSVTIDGVNAVVDSGLARVATHSAWTGMPALQIARISKASAKQRAGRAGRTGPGVAVRLYPQEDFSQRLDQDVPALLRSDLSGLCLSLRAMGLQHALELVWLETPPESSVRQAEELLELLEVNEENCRELARLPVSPRLARMLVEAKRLGVLEQGIEVAAFLGSGVRPIEADLSGALAEPQTQNVTRQVRQLRALLRPTGRDTGEENALLQAVLCGFPDRVAQRRAGRQILLANGTSLELADDATSYPFMVVLDGEARSDRHIARVISRIEPEWLLDRFAGRVREDTTLEWNEAAERVDARSALRYGAVTLEESRHQSANPAAAAALLVEKAEQAGLDRFVDGPALQGTLARIEFAGLPKPDLSGALAALCAGLRSFTELREAAGSLLSVVQAEAGSKLRQLAPETVRLPGGRVVKVSYEPGKPPWIASRLQDFFGMEEAPRLGPQQTPVVVHLLAPNQRAVQTTADLAGFWTRLYPQVRRELMRRYPRHAWPEKPAVGDAPKQGR